MADPYEILEVSSTATQDDIRKAYRRLAKKFHPDLNPGNKDAEEKFKQLSGAHAIISDVDKRKRFDAGEIDGSGAESANQSYYKDFASGKAGRPYANNAGYADFAGVEDIFSEMFGSHSGRTRRSKGQDLHFKLTIGFLEAVNGTTKRISLPEGGTLDLTITPGMRDGKIMRLRGKGEQAAAHGEAGDALVEILVEPHKFFVRREDDILVDLPVTLGEAVLGARVKVPTPSGAVMLSIPKGSNNGSVLRLKGKGVPHPGGTGDEFVKLQIVLPKVSDPELETFLSNWNSPEDYEPRREMEQ